MIRNVLALLLLLFAVAPASAEGLADLQGRYRVEPDSVIRFSVRQFGGGAIEGTFTTFSGRFVLGGKNAERSEVHFELAPASVSAVDPRVEDFIRSEAVFDVARYPTVSFRSDMVTRTGDNSARLDGRLSAKGVTRETHFLIEYTGRKGDRLTFHVSGKMSRALFNMDVGTPIYSNMVELDMDLIGRRQ